MDIWKNITTFFKGNKQIINKFNQTFFWGQKYTHNDDTDLTKYVDDAYNVNSVVFSVINQISNKLVSIPYFIKEVEDKQSNIKLNTLLKATNYNPSFTQKIRFAQLEKKALSENEYPMPFNKPNPNQDWNEFFKLSETFLALTGNVYWYKLKPENGMNAGEPIQLYCLPSHMMEIVLKDNADMLGVDDVIAYYKMTNFNQVVRFNTEDVVHVSIDNPNYGLSGEQLYGQSRLRAVWKNVVALNKGNDLNIEMLKNAGVFGFIHGKGTDFIESQGKAIKERLLEARSSTEDLANIMGSSFDMGFTRISLTTDELKIFEHLKYNEKQICNALGWSDTLLNNDEGGKYDKQVTELKRVLINTIIPDAKILERAFNEGVLAEIKAYKNKSLVFDYKEMPELQDDLEKQSKWVLPLADRGYMNGNEVRLSMGLPESENPLHEEYTVKDDVMSLQDALLPSDELEM